MTSLIESIEKIFMIGGLGIFLITAWIFYFLGALKFKSIREFLLFRYQVILGFIIFTVAIWGLFSLINPPNGFPGWTKQSINSNLGGSIGSMILGDSLINQILRISSLIFLTLIVIKPKSSILIVKFIKIIFQLLRIMFKKIISNYWSKNSTNKSTPIPEYSTNKSTLIPENSPLITKTVDDRSRSTSKSSWGSAANNLGYFVVNEKEEQKPHQEILSEEKSEGTVSDFNNQHNARFSDPNEVDTDPKRQNQFWETSPMKDPIKNTEEITTTNTSKKKWALPDVSLLSSASHGGISPEEISETSQIIKKTFAEYKVEIEVEKVRPGPTVTMYGIQPGWVRKNRNEKTKDENGNQIISKVEEKTRVSVDNILRREKDLALALKTPSLRIETPVMGESLLGIEVPNPNPSLVALRNVMESKIYKDFESKAALPIALGKGSDGDEVVFDLTKMPHLLIAGATGSGKSVCINAIISCLIMERTPEQLQMVLVDPKRVELTPYNQIPHLIEPVIVETDQVVNTLKGIIREMMDRYRQMEEIGARNIESYNQKSSSKFPYIVVAIDELADLMMTAAFDVEQSICRLAQLGRATGIHLIIATQRPSVDVITGLIKANFPGRISFAVTSQIDSRTIMDTSGAEKLLGRGDMLYQPIDGTRPSRVQNVFISDDEIKNLVSHWKNNPKGFKPQIDIHTIGDPIGLQSNIDASSKSDQLIDQAIAVAQKNNKISTSLLQRRLRIGYPRAARLMDELEDMGIVSASDGSKSRDVLISS